MKGLSVCFYIANMSGGGAERVFLNLMNYAASKSCDVTLILNSKEGDYLDYVSKKIKIVELGTYHPFKTIRRLISYFNQNKTDIAFSTLTQCNYALVLARLFGKAKFKVVVREANSFLTKRKKLSTVRLAQSKLMVGVLYRLADEVIVNSEGSRNELAEAMLINRKRIKIIPNPLNIHNIRQLAEHTAPAKLESFLQGRPFIVAIGRLENAKGFDVLIEALKGIKDRSICLVILGMGSEYQTLKNLIEELSLKDRVLLFGFAENPYSIMSKAKLFVLSSRFEGMPNVLLEAMVLRLPIVATDCPSGPAELLKGGLFGKLVPVNNNKALTNSINKQLHKNYVDENAREEYIEKLDLKKVANLFFDLATNK